MLFPCPLLLYLHEYLIEQPAVPAPALILATKAAQDFDGKVPAVDAFDPSLVPKLRFVPTLSH